MTIAVTSQRIDHRLAIARVGEELAVVGEREAAAVMRRQADNAHGDERQDEEEQRPARAPAMTSAQGSDRRTPAARAELTTGDRSLRLQHLGPDVLHLLVEIGVGRRIGLRARQEARLLVEAQVFFCSSVSAALVLAGMPQ